ncbi:MAG: hypothetical protein AB7U59_17440 [Desulfovibrionaceae bacterium]
MQREMDMWRITPESASAIGYRAAQTETEVGYLVAVPASSEAIPESIDDFEESVIGVCFPLTKEGFRAGHAMLRTACRQAGDTLIQ